MAKKRTDNNSSADLHQSRTLATLRAMLLQNC